MASKFYVVERKKGDVYEAEIVPLDTPSGKIENHYRYRRANSSDTWYHTDNQKFAKKFKPHQLP